MPKITDFWTLKGPKLVKNKINIINIDNKPIQNIQNPLK